MSGIKKQFPRFSSSAFVFTFDRKKNKSPVFFFDCSFHIANRTEQCVIDAILLLLLNKFFFVEYEIIYGNEMQTS